MAKQNYVTKQMVFINLTRLHLVICVVATLGKRQKLVHKLLIVQMIKISFKISERVIGMLFSQLVRN